MVRSLSPQDLEGFSTNNSIDSQLNIIIENDTKNTNIFNLIYWANVLIVWALGWFGLILANLLACVYLSMYYPQQVTNYLAITKLSNPLVMNISNTIYTYIEQNKNKYEKYIKIIDEIKQSVNSHVYSLGSNIINILAKFNLINLPNFPNLPNTQDLQNNQNNQNNQITEHAQLELMMSQLESLDSLFKSANFPNQSSDTPINPHTNFLDNSSSNILTDLFANSLADSNMNNVTNSNTVTNTKRKRKDKNRRTRQN